MVSGPKSTEMRNEDCILDAMGRLSSKKGFRFMGFETFEQKLKMEVLGGGGRLPLGP